MSVRPTSDGTIEIDDGKKFYGVIHPYSFLDYFGVRTFRALYKKHKIPKAVVDKMISDWKRINREAKSL